MGGLGIVYKGWDPVITREVAIKGLNKNSFQPDERESLLNRFRQKAQAIGRLVHPRIIQIYDFIENEQSAYIIMELVHGKTLAQHLEEQRKFRSVGDRPDYQPDAGRHRLCPCGRCSASQYKNDEHHDQQ